MRIYYFHFLQLEDEDRLHLLSFEDDEENQCIRLLSFCKRHKQPSNDRSSAEDRIARTVGQVSEFSPPVNQSGCARTGMLCSILLPVHMMF